MRPTVSLRGSRAGFTLIEVMVTLLIMSMIMVTITQVLTGVRTTRDEIHNIQERQIGGPAILQRLERDLRAMLVYNRERSQLLRIRNRVQSGLDADTIDFVCTVDALLPIRQSRSSPFLYGDVNEVGYHLRPRPDSDDFLELYRREDFGIDEDPFRDGRFALLHDRVVGFNIEVYEEDGPDAEPLESWDVDEDEEFVGLPARIEVELTIEMAPRLVREQLVIDRRTIAYRLVYRFPENLRMATNLQPVPYVPVIETPVIDATPGAGSGSGQGDANGNTGGQDAPFDTSGASSSSTLGFGDR